MERDVAVHEDTDPWSRWWTPAPWLTTDRLTPRRWPVVGVVFLFPVMIPAVRQVIDSPGMTAGASAKLVVALVYSACYVVFPRVLFGERRYWVKLAFTAVTLAIGWVLVLSGGSVYLLTYAMAIVAFALPPGWVLVLNGFSVVLGFVLAMVHGPVHGSVGDVLALAGITTSMFFMGRLVHTVRHLRIAQQEIATLAVTAERERLARDLHDILGHSLTTITVKAGLARRVLETTKDLDRAVAEIREVEDLSRSALSDVRATVSDYREVSLAAELVGARVALRAAEIDADLPQAVDNVRTDLHQPFGYVLREAITNVIRHAGAQQVKVRFGRNWLEIEDDGRSAPGSPGNGLRGLRERLARIGGSLAAEPRPGGGFLVRAEAPSPADSAPPRLPDVARQEVAG